MQTLQVSFTDRAGYVLRGIVTLPDGAGEGAAAAGAPAQGAAVVVAGERITPATPRPFVVHLHGFGGSLSGHKYMYTNLARALAREGIGCARFDFFGCGESDGEFGETTLTGFQHDAEDICAWAVEQGFATPETLFLSGQSMGGYVAASVAPRVSPRGLVLLCPGAAMWYGCAERADMVTKSGATSVDLEGLTYDMAFNYDMATHPDPFEEAAGYEGPVLIIRADDDKLVSAENCESYKAVYGERARSLETSGGGHNFSSQASRRLVEREMAGFINANR